MRKLIVSEFVSLDGVMQAPGGKDEDRDGGFEHGGWTMPYWHDDIGKSFFAVMKDADALLLGRRTYVTHAEAFEPMAPGNPFGDAMNAPRKYVVSKTLEKPIWRNTTIIRDNPMDAVRALKAEPGRSAVGSVAWLRRSSFRRTKAAAVLSSTTIRSSAARRNATSSLSTASVSSRTRARRSSSCRRKAATRIASTR